MKVSKATSESNFRMKLSSLCSPLVRYMQDLFRVKGQRSRSRISSGRTHNNGRISFFIFFGSAFSLYVCSAVVFICHPIHWEMKPARLVIAGSLATRDGKESKILGSCSVRFRFFIDGIGKMFTWWSSGLSVIVIKAPDN